MVGTTKSSNRMVKLVLVSSILAVSLASTACGSGISQEQFDAVSMNLEAQMMKLQSLESELATERATVADLQRSVQELQVQNTELENDLAEAGSIQSVLDAERVSNAVAGERLKVSSLEEQLASLLSALQEARATIDDLENQSASLQERQMLASSLQEQLAGLEGSLDGLRQRVDSAEVEKALLTAFLAWNRKDSGEFGSVISETASALLPEPLGILPISLRRLMNTEVSGDTATTHAMFGLGTQRNSIGVSLGRSDGVWRIQDLQRRSPKIMGATIPIDVQVDESEISLDASAVTNGNVAFVVTNGGTRPRRIVLHRLDLAIDPILAFQAEGPLPGSMTGVAFVEGLQPGEQTNIAFTTPLASGRYVILGVPIDPDGPVSARNSSAGMVAEFSVP